MFELIDPRPVFTIVMGCDGVGKTAWKRASRGRLPGRYFDRDSFAGGIGDWNSPEARERARAYVDAQIAESIEKRLDFGAESAYSGPCGQALVERAGGAGYRVEGIYLGTSDPSINAERIRCRVRKHTGHAVDPERIPARWRHSLSNLRTTAERFDQLRIFDNSRHDEEREPRLVEQCRLERGRVTWRADRPERWCSGWLERLGQRQESLARRARKAARGEARAGRDGPERGFSR